MSGSTVVVPDAQLLDRARNMRPRLIARQAETEENSFYPEATHVEFREVGFYKLLVPKRYGGYECDIVTYFRIVRELARGCPSTAWMFSQSVNHTLAVATFFSEPAQDEIFAYAGGEFRAPLTFKPGGTATRANSGWRINGYFHYNSGAPYSTHMMSHAILQDPGNPHDGKPMLFIVPREAYEIIDNWGDVLGLRGSGSHSIRVENAVIPEDYAIPGQTLMSMTPTEATGRALHDNPLYCGNVSSFLMLGGTNVAVGIAKGAADVYEAIMDGQSKRRDDADYQRWFGRAAGQVSTAEYALDALARDWVDLSINQAWTREDELRFLGVGHEVVDNLAWQAIQDLIRTCGSSHIRKGERMERLWRDYTQLFSHGWQLVYDAAARDFSRERMDAAIPSGTCRTAVYGRSV